MAMPSKDHTESTIRETETDPLDPSLIKSMAWCVGITTGIFWIYMVGAAVQMSVINGFLPVVFFGMIGLLLWGKTNELLLVFLVVRWPDLFRSRNSSVLSSDGLDVREEICSSESQETTGKEEQKLRRGTGDV